MPTTIRSNTSFEQGDLVLVSSSSSVAEDGLVTAQMNFACLASQLGRWSEKFALESPPPVQLPAHLAGLPLVDDTVFLIKHKTTTSKGIAYRDATYVGCSRDQKFRPSISIDRRSFSGTSGNDFYSLTESFDYDAETLSVSFCQFGDDDPPPVELNPQTRAEYNGKYSIDVSDAGFGIPVQSGTGRFFQSTFSNGQLSLTIRSGASKEILRTESSQQIGPVARRTVTASARYIVR